MNDLISNKIQIETETVSTKDGKHTYSITGRIVGNDGSKAVMVMLYPTRSALKMNTDDSTFFHLTQHLVGIFSFSAHIHRNRTIWKFAWKNAEDFSRKPNYNDERG